MRDDEESKPYCLECGGNLHGTVELEDGICSDCIEFTDASEEEESYVE